MGFRYFTLRAAHEIEVTGWVRNCVDGSVEAVACGSAAQLELFEKKIKKGPMFSHVEKVQRLELDGEESFDQFTIRP